MGILNIVTYIPLIGALVILFFVNRSNSRAIRITATATAVIDFIASLFLWANFDKNKLWNFTESYEWIPSLGVKYTFGIDGIALLLILLTTFMGIIAVVSSYSAIHQREKEYYTLLLLLQTGMIGTFCALDFFLFYVFWEIMLVPMYFIIGIWGGKRRIYAAMKFFLFTLVGSVLMFLAILYAGGVQTRTTGFQSFSILDWTRAASNGAWNLAPNVEALLFLAFALAFLVKVPLFPLHTWLPDAHVEAPTGGSILLAGVLLKLGTYGLLRFCLPLFPNATARFTPLLALLAIVGVVYGAWVAAAQQDMKKLVAYSSVSHLALVVLGILAGNATALSGAVFQMVAHGLTTGLLFLLVGVLYERRHTREMADYGGVAARVPVTTTLFLVAAFGSIGLPGLVGFVGEFLILSGVFAKSVVWCALGATGMILGAIYLLTLVQKVFWGPLRVEANKGLSDVNGWELAGALPIVLGIVALGVYPAPLLAMVKSSVDLVVQLAQAGVKP